MIFLTTVVVFNYSGGGGGGGGGDVYGRINRAPGCGRTKNSFAVLSQLWESAKLLTFKKVSLFAFTNFNLLFSLRFSLS